MLDVLNTLIIAFEQDNRVLLTEIDLWLYAHVTHKCFLEIQSLTIQALRNMLYVCFFLETYNRDLVASCGG